MIEQLRLRILLPFAGLVMVCTLASAQEPGPEIYARVEGLSWRIQDAPLPVLLTATPDSGPRALLGGQPIDMGTLPGGRLTTGIWLDREFGVEIGAFYVNSETRYGQFADDTGNLRFGQPYFNVVTGGPAVHVLSAPGSSTPSRTIFIPDSERTITIPGSTIPGSTAIVRFATWSELLGSDVNGMIALGGGGLRFELLAGFRYFRLAEAVQMEASSFPSTGGSLTTVDSFTTRNNFYGGQAGARFVFDLAPAYADLTAKVAAGDMVEQVDVAGALRTPSVYPGGVYAQRTNMGSITAYKFAVVSEVQANAGVQFGPLRAFAGYSIIYASSVARPGNQIGAAINPNQSEALTRSFNPPGIGTGLIAPPRGVNTSSFWAEGVSVGLELRY